MTDPTPEDVERVALLPCPFCSGEARVFNHLAHWSIACRKCGVAFTQPSQEKVIVAWNRRAMPDHSALIRELRDALKKWGSHNGWCASNKWPTPGKGFAPCACGFDAALRKANDALGEKAN